MQKEHAHHVDLPFVGRAMQGCISLFGLSPRVCSTFKKQLDCIQRARLARQVQRGVLVTGTLACIAASIKQ